MKKISMHDIAKMAGTSIATVSRVLNSPSHTCQKKELADKIWQIASQYHYVPNSTARDLRKGTIEQTSVCPIDILFTRFESFEKDDFFLELFQCIKGELLKSNYSLGKILHIADIVSPSNNTKTEVHIPYKKSGTDEQDSSFPSLSQISKSRSSGLIIIGKCPANLVDILAKKYSYMVGIDRNPTNFLYDEVICDGSIAAQTAMEYLISLGHTNIAYIGDCTNENRYIGYYNTLLRHNCPLNYSFVYPTDQTYESGIRALKKILTLEEKPSAIFCANDTTALGVLDALKSIRGKKYIPSVISIDNIRAAETSMLTTVSIPKEEMAHLALVLLLDRQKQPHTQPVRVECSSPLIIRDSCHPLSP